MSAPRRPSSEEALQRARTHGRRAVSEALLATQALLDAGSISLSGNASEHNRYLSLLSKALEDVSQNLASESGQTSNPLFSAIVDALDSEIARWQTQADADPEARAVLRAFLGLREILWEVGIRRPPDSPQETSPKRPKREPHSRTRRPPPRIQKVPVEG